MDFMINEVPVKTEKMILNSEIVHDKPNINVTTKEIRLKWVAGVVSIISITITPQAAEAEAPAVRKEVYNNTFVGGDCMTNTKNCVFNEAQLNGIKCDGVFVKIGAKATAKESACMFKCVDTSFATLEECNAQLPETLKCTKKGAGYSIG